MKNILFFISLTLFGFISFAQKLTVNSIFFEGNKVTKSKILYAELTINNNDSIDEYNLINILKENEIKIYNLQLFHWVKAKYTINETKIDIVFEMQERWYIWPIPIFSLADRNLNAWLNKMDFNRIDYGLHTAWYNFRGRNEQLISNIQLGFNQKYELFYKVPQINKKQTLGLDFGASLFQSRYIDYLNINSLPQTLRLNNNYPITRKYVRIGLINRNTVENIRNLRLELNQQTINDSVLMLNPNYHLTNSTKTFLQIEINQIFNKRKTFSYPISGSFLEVALRQRFFFEKEESPSTRLQLFYSKYLPISKKSFYSVGVNSQYTLVNKVSASENIALGYKQNIRGFDFYVIDGQNYAVIKQNLNITVIDNKNLKFKFIPSEKFNEVPLSIYIGLLGDIGYVIDNKYASLNTLSNQVLYSGGIGLHLVSYYDQVFVIEYTVNSLNEQNIFISTKFSF